MNKCYYSRLERLGIASRFIALYSLAAMMGLVQRADAVSLLSLSWQTDEGRTNPLAIFYRGYNALTVDSDSGALDSGAAPPSSLSRIGPITNATIAGTGYKGTVNNGTANTANWSNSGNWDSTGPAADERNLFFGQGYKAAGGTNFIANNDIASYSGYRITFQDSNAAGNGTDGTSANDTAFTITGNSFTLFDFGSGAFPRIENDSFLTQTFTLTSGNTITLSGGSNNKAEINPVNGNLIFSTGTKIDLAGTTQLQMFGGKTVTYNGIISSSGNGGANSVTINAGTTAVYGAANTYTGDTFINNGTLQLAANGSVATGSGIRLGNTGGGNATLAFTSLTGGVSVGSLINPGFNGGTSTYLIDSQNTSNTNTISGNIFMDAALRINQAAGGTLSISNATLDLKAQTLTLTGAATSLINISGVIGNSTGSGQVVLGVNGTAGGPTVTLASASTYSGDTFVRAGALQFSSAGNLTNSTIRLGSSSGSSVTANINLTTLTGGTTISSTINPVTTSGSGTLTLNSQNTSGTNTYSGHIGMDRDFTITQAAGGTLNITQARAGGAGTTTGADIKGFTLTLNNAGTINVAGDIYNSTGSGSLAKTGAGTAVLSGVANTYTGSTSVTGGTLAGIGANAFGSTSGISIGGSGTLSLRGDTSTTFVKASDNTTRYAATTTANGATINVDQATVGGTGAKTMTIGALTLNNAITNGTNFTGANNTSLSVGAVTTSAAASGTETITNSITGGGSLTLASISVLRTGTPTLAFAGNGDTTVTGAISQAATTALTKSGTGTLTLSGTNAFTGGTTLTAGTIKMTSASALGAAGSNVSITSGATLQYASDSAINAYNVSIPSLSGGISNIILDRATAGAAVDQTITSLTFPAASNSGGQTLNATIGANVTSGTPVLTINSVSGPDANLRIAHFAGNVAYSIGSMTATNPSGTGTFTFDGTSAGNRVTGVISNSGTGGTTALTVNATSGTWTLWGANTYTGATTITSGTLQLGDGTSGRDGTIAGASIVNNSALVYNIFGTPVAYSGVISGSGTLTKVGGGSQTLSGANTYNGATTVSAGTLALDSAGSTTARLVNTSGITLNSGGTLLLNNSSGTASTNRINNAATVTLAGGTFNLGGQSEGAAGTTGIGALTLTSTSTLDFGTLGSTNVIQFAGVTAHTSGQIFQIMDWEGTPGSANGGDRLLFAGTSSSFTGLYSQSEVSFNGGPTGYGTTDFGTYYEVYGFTPVPEPSTWAAGVLAIGGVAFMQRRRLQKLVRRSA